MKKNLKLLTVFLLSAVMFTGCSSSSGRGSMSDNTAYSSSYKTAGAVADIYGTDSAAVEEAAYSDEAYSESSSVSAESGSSTEVSEQNVSTAGRKLITRMNMNVQTEYFDELQATVEKRVGELGGYIESSDLWNGSGYNHYSNVQRTLSLVIRVPSDKLDDFVQTMSDNSNIVSSSKSVEDVTLTYVDLESHKTALETEEKRLLELMEKAENMEDIIAIESRLTDVRYQLQSMESQLRTYDNQIDYSTINLDINEVERITPPAQESAKDRILTGITESFYDVSHGLKEFGINLIIDLPYIIVWLVVIIILILIVKLLIRIVGGKEHRIRRAQKKEEKRQRRLRTKEEKQSDEAAPQNAPDDTQHDNDSADNR